MPTLNWIGKDAVIRHHKDVPFRLLEPDAGLSHGDGTEGNLIVEGDNLHALKALLPKYAGKVKCIYIDPPYNTGNEGWVYNDNVKSPEITKWLGEVVGKEAEDLSRHDKWLCMMYPKPTRLIERILQITSDKDSIILDSFAGSGTTAHAVLKQNAEDGGNRKFILVEMEEKIAQTITSERVRRVAGGYTNSKGEKVEGLGSGFQYCRLSEEPLFNEFGDIRNDVTFAQLADFVWFSETGLGFTGAGDSPLLGVHEGTAIYLLFNGILGDRRPQGGNILTKAILDALPPHDGPKVIYAAATRLGSAALQREQVIFKQTPYAIEV